MSNELVPIGQAKMPAGMKARLAAGAAANKNFAEGVADSFPRLSIKGKNFAIRVEGQTNVLRDPHTKIPLNYLDLVLVNGSKTLSKSYYASDFQDDGDFTPPDCWSLDSIRPDATVAVKQNPTCVNCPKNAFGSAPSRDGTARAGKACQDARRIAVMFVGQLEQENPLIFMLRVPQTSLKNLKKYAEMLARFPADTAACVTRLTFEEVAYPKLQFNFVDALSDTEYATVTTIADGSFVASMLNAPDFDNAATQTEAEQASAPPPRTRQATPLVGDAEPAGQPQEAAAPPPGRQQATTPPVRGKPDLKVVPSTVIDLPDGRRFDTATNQYVEAAPEPDMPELDPETIVLPDGRFFNKTTNTFVTGPEVGAKAFVAEAVPTRKKAAAPKKKAAAAEPPADQQKAVEAKAGRQQVVMPEKANGSPQDSQPVDTPQGNGAEPVITPSPAGLDEMLASVLPGKK
jgi:hypothetical protein